LWASNPRAVDFAGSAKNFFPNFTHRMLPAVDIRCHCTRSGEDPRHALFMFTKMCSHTSDKFTGDPDESYAAYESAFLLNMLVSKIDPEDAANVVQKTLTKNALKIYKHRCGGTEFERAEDVLYHLSANFEDESSSDRVDEQFHTLSFAKFRRQKHVKELTEVEAVKLFYTKLLGWQSQLEPVYQRTNIAEIA
jgi:hypothetical protein